MHENVHFKQTVRLYMYGYLVLKNVRDAPCRRYGYNKQAIHVYIHCSPVARIVSVASNFWKRQGRSYGNALARAILGRSLRQKRSVVRDRREFYPCDRDDRKRLSIDRIFLMETGFKRQKRQKRWDISHDAPDCLLHVYFTPFLQNGGKQLE